MKPMFLPDVEGNARSSPYAALIRGMQESGAEYPQIWHMFAFLPKATDHLARFTELLETYRELTNTIQKFFIENSRLGIPVFYHDECLHGHWAPGGTSFSQPIGLARVELNPVGHARSVGAASQTPDCSA